MTECNVETTNDIQEYIRGKLLNSDSITPIFYCYINFTDYFNLVNNPSRGFYMLRVGNKDITINNRYYVVAMFSTSISLICLFLKYVAKECNNNVQQQLFIKGM